MASDPGQILGADGALARAIGAGFESRPQQLDMAAAVAEAMQTRSHLLVEAGTGVGKSFAYLVPAMLRCVLHHERVVVSTHTIALQEQLIQKDIPLLQAALEQAGVIPRREEGAGSAPCLRAVLVKGRSNYVSIRRLRLASSRQDALFASAGARVQLHQIEDWAYRTADGTRATLPRLEHPEVWTHVESDTDNCMGAKCPHHAECFYQSARRAMERANLLVCNHALFFSDLALRALDTGFLPRYDHVVLDEAHAAEDVAAEHLGMSLTEGRVQFLLRTLLDARRGKGYLANLIQNPLAAPDSAGPRRAAELVGDAWAASAQFFDDWRRLVDSGRFPTGRIREPGLVENVLTPVMKELALRLQALRDDVRAEADKFELSAYARRAAEIASGAEAFVNQADPRRVYWVEAGGGPGADSERARTRRIGLACAPVDVAPLLKELLFTRDHSVTLTSATLAAGGRAADGAPGRRRGASGGPASAVGRRVVALEDEGPDAEEGSSVGEGAEPAPVEGARGPFALVMSRLGCGGARTLLLGSPFDYAAQMEVHIEGGAPDPHRSSAFGKRRAEVSGDAGGGTGPSASAEDRLAVLVLSHLDATGGGAFVLFNSFGALRRMAGRLAAPLAERDMPLLVHEPEAPRSELLRRFRDDPRSVLLGAASFWQGVDVPGRALRNVIIAQLPFEPPDRPLTEARLELLTSRGGDPFRDDSLPRAVIRFKQGIGRLIRTKTDTGRVVILDPRVVTKGYGRAFLNALPAGVTIRRA